ncbi:endonuclease [Luteolibacter luteus]|uniref:Endonuclease n=1 Tax=Luteolibacter luteus TaxID=2728835 RepID=A0A858RPW2_9BACT|nr:endonuclease [Luteolibacter luteus]QJE98912.1 endonuclease [Luteolibacter luteus]
MAASHSFAGEAYVEKQAMPSPHATQAAAADEKFVYAVSSTAIAKLDRATGEELALSKGKASHLNSAVILDGKVYAAHSNFPLKPEQGEIRVLDPETMELGLFHRFDDPPGSLTWALRKGKEWWCHFAHYGKDNTKSLLLRFDESWHETGRWDYPADLVKDWGSASLSGAVWQGDVLLATGHDHKRVYRLKLPAEGKTMQWIDTVDSPFPGQGIAADPKTGGLVGIDRTRKAVIFTVLERR